MDNETLITLLEDHLKQSKEATDIYKIRLGRTIGRLKEGYFEGKDEELIVDLQALGFQDKAALIRRGMYV